MEIIFNESTGLYFYSALLQANAAIIALIGLYTTFRIQAANASIDSIRNYFFVENAILRDYCMKFEGKSLEEKKEYVGDAPRENIEKQAFKRWLDNLILINEFKRGIILPTMLMGIALILNSIFLFLTSSLHSFNTNIEIICAVLNLIYEIILVIVISSRVIKLVTFKSSSD